MRAWQQRAVRGPEYAQAVRASKVNLNIIDPTNYPAANMRFFEIPAAGGLQLSSSCPEMESEFQHGEHVFYYKGPSEAQAIIRRLLSDDMLRNKVAEAGHQKVLARHTYTQRAQQILSWVEEDSLAH
jgi:spore maturation protein CgeB